MKSMDKISTGIAYGTSAGSAGYWFLQWLDQVSPSQWAAYFHERRSLNNFHRDRVITFEQIAE